MVSSHNDLFEPDNILFDGHRIWLVDWEAAFLNDRYAELAVVANLVTTNEAEERIYLQEYFGQPPDQHQLARLLLMQQLAHMFYGMVFLWLGSSGNPIDWSEAEPEFREFHQRIWAGEVDLADNHTKTVYGRVHWEQLLQNMQQPTKQRSNQNRLRSECNFVKGCSASIFTALSSYLTGQHAHGEADKRTV